MKASLFIIWSNYLNSLCFKLLFIFLFSGLRSFWIIPSKPKITTLLFQLLHLHHEEITLLCVFSCSTYSGRHGTELGTYLSQFHRVLIDDIAMIHINIDTELCHHWHTGSCWTFSSAPRHLLNFFVSATNILVSIIIGQNTSTSFLRRLQYRLKTPALSYCSLLLFFAFIASPINRYYGNYQMSDLVWSCWGLS